MKITERFLIGYNVVIEWDDGSQNEFAISESGSGVDEVRYDTPFSISLLKSSIDNPTIYYHNGKQVKYILRRFFNEALNSVIDDRELKNIYYFTNINNLESIIDRGGLISRDLLVYNDASFEFNDGLRFDGRTDCICCSLEYPNNKLSYNIRSSSNIELVIIEIDIDILKNTISCCSFHNAARAKGGFVLPISKLDDIFVRDEETVDLPKNLPTDQQAEILVKDLIPITYFKKIYTRTAESFYKAKELFFDFTEIKVEFNRSIFYQRG